MRKRRASRVRDLAELSRARAHLHDGRVDIAGLADPPVDEARPHCLDLDRILAHEEARHVEIVDHHVAEEAARAFHVIDRRGR